MSAPLPNPQIPSPMPRPMQPQIPPQQVPNQMIPSMAPQISNMPMGNVPMGVPAPMVGAPPAASPYPQFPQFGFLPGPPKQPKNPPPTTPRQTLYIHNLNEKVKLDVMKKSLEAVFSQFGEVLEITVKKSLKMRGQAFVVMKDVESATSAMKAVQGFSFYNKLMDIQYARINSDIVAKKEGTYEQQKRQREEEKERRKRELKKPKIVPQPVVPKPVIVPIFEEPNNILFIQNLPQDVTKESVTSLFQQYPGFREVRLVPGKKELAFIEYDNEQQAGIARKSLNGFHMSETNAIKVSFAKK